MGILHLLNLQTLRRLAASLAELCYPASCPLCNAPANDSTPLCSACSHKLHAQVAQPACPLCAKPLPSLPAPCPWCLGKGLYPYDRILRLATFDHPLKNLIHQIKYRRRWAIAEMLADRLAQQPLAQQLLHSADLLIPVPLHIRRHFSRGYNQADIIARRLAMHAGLTVARPVKRIRNTPTQTHLTSQKARHDNVRGAFKLLRPLSVHDKHLVVVDDVMTSGATLQAVGRELLHARPASLSAIVLAVADPKHHNFQTI